MEGTVEVVFIRHLFVGGGAVGRRPPLPPCFRGFSRGARAERLFHPGTAGLQSLNIGLSLRLVSRPCKTMLRWKSRKHSLKAKYNASPSSCFHRSARGLQHQRQSRHDYVGKARNSGGQLHPVERERAIQSTCLLAQDTARE